MFERIKEAGEHTVVFGVGGVLRKAGQFLLLPLYTRYLTPADYGILNLLLIASSMLLVIPSSVAGPSLLRSYYDYETEEERSLVVSTALFLCLAVAGLLLFIGISLSRPLSTLLTGNSQYALPTVLILVHGVSQSVNYVLLSVFRAQKWSLKYIAVSVGSMLVSLGVTIYLVVVQELNINGVIIGTLVGGLVATFLSVWMVRRHLQLKISTDEIRKMVSYGLPYIPASFINFAQNSADRFIIQSLLGPAAVGVYALAKQFGQIVQFLFVQPFSLIFPAIIFSAEKDPRAKEFYARLLTYFLLVAGFIGLEVSLLADDVIRLMAKPEYWTAGAIVPWICLALIIYGARDPAGVGLGIKRQTQWFPVALGGGVVIYLALMPVLIPIAGLTGVGVAMAVSYAVVYGIYYWASQRIYPLQFEVHRLIKLAVAIGVIFGVGRVVSIDSIWLSIVSKSVIVLAGFPALLLLFGFLDYYEMSRGLQFLRRWLTRVSP